MTLEGFGTTTTGGSGGTTYNVTNLNDSGAGSLRAALTASGTRTVKFQVYGNISLNSTISITNPNLTIDGSDAPGKGICLKMADPAAQEPCLWIKTHDVIIQYIRIRPGFSVAGRTSESQVNNASALRISNGATPVYNIVLDHCSFSWAIDEMVSTWDITHDVTIQWCMIYETFEIPGVGSSFGMLLGYQSGSQDMSIHHNLFAHNSQRNPRIDGVAVVDIVNNVMYNTNRHMDFEDVNGTPTANIVGNYQKSGADTNLSRGHIAASESATGSFFVEHNISHWRPTDTGDELNGILRVADQGESTLTRFTAPTITTETGPSTAYTEVLAGAGCTLPARDAADTRIVNDVINGTGVIIDDVSDTPGYPDLSPASSISSIRVAASTGGGTQDIRDPNLADTPNAALFVAVGATVDGTAADTIIMSIGATDGTNQWVNAMQNQHNVATTNADRRGATDEVIMFLDTAGAVSGEANFDSFLSDDGTGAGVRISWGVTPPAGYYILAFLFAAENVAVGVITPAGVVGNSVTETIGFPASLIFGSLHGQNLDDTTRVNAQLSFGACDSLLNQYAVNWNAADAQAAENLEFTIRNDGFAANMLAAADMRFEITAIGATSFDVTTRGVTDGQIGYLALNTGDLGTWVGGIDIPASVGNVSYTGPGFKPQLVGAAGGLAIAENTEYNNNTANSYCISIFTENYEFSQVISGDHFADPTDNHSFSDDQAIIAFDDTGALDVEGTLVSYDDTGFTLNVTNAPASVFKWMAWAIEAPSAVAEESLAGIGFTTFSRKTLSKPRYALWLTDDFGVRLTEKHGRSPLQEFNALTATRALNNIGNIQLQVPATFDQDLIGPDRMIQLWRAPVGGRLALWRVYFLRRWKFEQRGGEEVVTLYGPDTLELLRRRIVAAFTNSAQALQTDFADDMMKTVVTQSIADGVAPTPTAGTRVWNDLTIAADLGLGPSITLGFPYHTLLTTSGDGVLATIAKAAKEADGTNLFFDIVPNVVTNNSINFIFQTYTGQLGQDRSNFVTFSGNKENMRNPSLEEDFTNEENYIYATGQGEETDREVVQVYDTARYSVSQWARIEGQMDARNETGAGLTAAGNDRLNSGRPIKRFSAIPLDVEGSRFQIDWDFGDLVTSKYRNNEFTSLISTVTLVADQSGDDVQARLDSES